MGRPGPREGHRRGGYALLRLQPQEEAIGSPGLDKLEAIAGAMGFPLQLWFDEVGGRAPDAALAAALEDETAREILGEVLRMGPKDRQLLLGIARQIPPPDGARGA